MKTPTLFLFTTLALAGCVAIQPPVVRDIAARRPLRDIHQCVTEQLVDEGYYIIETRRDDGVLRGEQASFRVLNRNNEESDGFNAVDILIFERANQTTSIQYKAFSVRKDRSLASPTAEVLETAERIATACA